MQGKINDISVEDRERVYHIGALDFLERFEKLMLGGNDDERE